MREIKSITGLRVISVDEGASVGTVSQVVVDLAAGTVLGLIVANGSERGVAVADIQTMGSDVIMISSREVARPLADLPELEKRKTSSVHLVPVFTNAGRRLGVVSSIFIDPLEKVVTHYEVSSGAIKDLADGLLTLPIIAGTVHGQDAVIVPEGNVRELGRESGGLFARFSQWGDSARKQYQQVAESAEKMAQSGSEALKKEAAVVREKAKEVSEKAKVVGEKVGKEVSEKAKEVSEKAKEVGKEAGTKAREAVSHLGEDEEERIGEPPAEAAAPAEGCAGDDKPACGCGCDAQES